MRDERNPARNDTTVRILILWLALSLLLRAPRVLADDEVDYSHEWYREDNNRMSIDTDSVLGNFDINKYLSVSGHFVEDAITGATPTGAPPQAEWPFPTYAYYYDRAFSQAFTAAIDNPNNLILYQSGVFTSYQAYTNYVAHTTPQLKTEAASAAGASYYSLTNNSNFHNTTVPLTHLHDHRTAFSMDLPITLGPNTFTPEVSQSKEDDYHSYGCALNDSLLLNQKNTTLNAGWSFDNDRVRDDTLIHWPKKISHDFLVGVNQVIDPVSYVTWFLDVCNGC